MVRSLTQKIITVMAVFWVLLGTMATLAIYSINVNRRSNAYLTTHTAQLSTTSYRFSNELYRAVKETEIYLLTGAPAARAEVFDALDQAQQDLEVLRLLNQEDRSLIGLPPLTEGSQTQPVNIYALVDFQVTQTLRAVDTADEAQRQSLLADIGAIEDQLEQFVVENQAQVQQEVDATNRKLEGFNNRSIVIAPVVFTSLLLLSILLVWLLRRVVVRPIKRLSRITSQVATGDLDQSIESTSQDEVGMLQRSFSQMLVNLRAQRAQLREQNANLQASLENQQRLFETVQLLSAPLLPIREGVIVLPIVGHVDTQRAEEITNTLLHGIQQRRAHTAILDVTGIAMLDTHVMNLIIGTVQAARLLGTRVFLAGISAEMAQLIVEQEITLTNIQTYRDLSAAIAAAEQGRQSIVRR